MAKPKTRSNVPASIEHSPSELQNPVNSREIASLAYRLWEARGCPEGTPEVDWFHAEQLLREPRNQTNSQVSEPLLVRGSGA